jgi:Fe-S oxidoreductase/nitrate reductase gamma subunit
MLVGFARLRSTWRAGQDEDRPGDWTGLISYLLGQKKILRNQAAGIAHLMVFWGFLFYLVIAILAQFCFAMPRLVGSFLSLISDIIGIAMLAGIVFFLIRRIQSSGPESPKRVVFPVVVLLIVVVSGFLSEGARLKIVEPATLWTTPLGAIFASISPSSPFFMQGMIRVHFFGVLVFIAILPFTFMRHLVTAPLNAYYRKQPPCGALREMTLDEEGPIGAGHVGDLSWKQLLDAQACVSCGRCEESCPAFVSGKPLSPRRIIRQIRDQMNKSPDAPFEGVVTADEIWACTTCMACVEQCPVYAEPVDKIMHMRRHQVLERGLLPSEARPMIRNLEIYGDINGKGLSRKEDWAIQQEIHHISEENLNPEILLWVGCSGAFHPKYQEVTRAMVKILKAGEVRFGILGKEEVCCGDAARRLGDEELFLDLARKNVASFKKYHIKKVVALCPHGFNTLKNEYPTLGAALEVIHAIEFALELIETKRIHLKYPVEKRMTIHDPCYLGRANHIYDPLRKIVRFIPGLNLSELERNRESAFCCGGGGGRMWLHEKIGANINTLRAQEIRENGAELVGTACPFCLTMLDDGVNSLEMEKPPKVMDIIEVVASSLEWQTSIGVKDR